MSSEQANNMMSKYQKGLTIFMYSLAGLLVPLSAIQPSGLSLYWATSGAVGILFNLIVVSPKFRRFVRIPHVPTESATPYLDIKHAMLKLYNRVKF